MVAIASTTWTGLRFAGFAITDVLLVAAGVGALYRLLRRRSGWVTPWWVVAFPVGAFLTLAVHTIVYGNAVSGTVQGLNAWYSGDSVFSESSGSALWVFRLVMATLVVALVIFEQARCGGPRTVRMLAQVFVLGAFASALAAILEALGILNLDPVSFRAITERSTGFANHPNSLALSMVVGLPIAVALAADSRSRRLLRGIFGTGAIAMLLALFLADSRAGLIGGAIAIFAVVSVLLARWRQLAWALPVMLVASAASLVVGDRLVGGTRFNSEASSVSSDQRTQYLEAAWQQFNLNPVFGVGLGQGSGVMVAALLLSSGGILLFVSFLVFYFFGLKDGAKARHDLVGAGIIIASVAVLVMGFANNSVAERFDYVPLFLAAALARFVDAPAPRVPSSSYSRAGRQVLVTSEER